jgi:D-aminopeptidase
MQARDLGVAIGTGTPGEYNAITDVAGVSVGHTTLIEGEGPLTAGRGPVRTGVTVIDPVPDDIWTAPVFAGFHRLNGKGDMTGIQWLQESGMLSTPIALSNTNALGTIRTGLIRARAALAATNEEHNAVFSGQPVCGETNDSTLNDIAGFHITEDHVAQALAAAHSGPVEMGSVGGGTGMICHDFKGGIGSASRVVETGAGRFTVGVLVQANHGNRERFAVNGVPLGRLIDAPKPVKGPTDSRVAPPPPGDGSIIVTVATDAPLLPHQLNRIAQRAGLGIARLGGTGEYTSGDFIVSFSTGNRLSEATRYPERAAYFDDIRMLTDRSINPLYWATAECTEEAIVNALLSAETMTGRDGNTAHALPHDQFRKFMGA